MSTHKNKYCAGDVTFVNSKSVPFQRWYPYIQGYSLEFVKKIIENSSFEKDLIYEPFAGTGTTMFASDLMGVNTVYSEVNPLLRYLIEIKMEVLKLPVNSRIEIGNLLIEEAEKILDDCESCDMDKGLRDAYDNVFGKSTYFPQETYNTVLKLRTYIDNYEHKVYKQQLVSLLTVAVFSILLDVSYLKKQGDVRFKTEAERATEMKAIADVLPQKIRQIAEDVLQTETVASCSHNLIVENAKEIGSVEMTKKISMVITSPPYLNGTNYFRNTKLELWFLRKLDNKQDLRKYRDAVLTSAICDVKKEGQNISKKLQSNLLQKVLLSLADVAYDKRIPIMIRNYFEEMHSLFDGLKKHLKKGAEIYIDIGDSVFCGIHVPTDYILTEILVSMGYESKERVILRQRRSRNQAVLSQVLLKYIYNDV